MLLDCGHGIHLGHLFDVRRQIQRLDILQVDMVELAPVSEAVGRRQIRQASVLVSDGSGKELPEAALTG